MSQAFVKGRTDNHLTWVMVDATDFATPESAASAATTIKVYGKLRANDTVHFVSSGTGSLTNDIKHVGASVLGIYTIGLVKADLSDASAAWYDQYIIALSCTGCARQTLVVDGGIDASAISAYQSRLSDILSQTLLATSAASDAASAAAQANSRVLLTQSLASDAHSAATQANSRVLLVQSRLSDFDSRLVSDVSDLMSQLLLATSAASDAASAAAQANSRVLLVQSRLSDLDSRLVSDISDLRSQASDIYSGMQALESAFIGHTGSTASQVADASMMEIDGIDHDDQFNGYFVKILGGSQVDELRLVVDTDKTSSKLTVKPAFLSRLASGVDFVLLPGDPMGSRFHSDIQSRALVVQSMASDAASAAQQANSRVLLTQSLASDAHSAAAQGNSRVLVVQSRLSDFDSRLVSDVSDLMSQLLLATSAASDAASAAAQGNSRILLVQSRLSDLDSRLVSDISDIRSAISDAHSDLKSAIGGITVSITASDVSDIASAVVAALPITSAVSDIYSMLSDFYSDFQSRVPKLVATNSQVSDLASDVKSAVVVAQSLASDAHSAATQANSRVLVAQSGASDAASAAQQANSRVLLVQSRLSDFDSRATSEFSDIRSAIAAITVSVSASDISDIASAVWANTIGARVDSRLLLTQSFASDAHSAAAQANSRALVHQSQASDIYSLLSDLHSDVTVASGIQSDIYSALQAGLTLTTAERNAIADAHLDRADAIETGLTPRQAHRLEAAAAAGKLSGAATTNVLIRNAVADSKNRIDATVDQDGNRTAVTTDVT